MFQAGGEKYEKMVAQMNEARKLIEELETDKTMAIAEAKRTMHEALELKDVEVTQARDGCLILKQENEELEKRVEKLERTGIVLSPEVAGGNQEFLG